MTRSTLSLLAVAIFVGCTCTDADAKEKAPPSAASAKPSKAGALSDAFKVQRPEGGEYFGLYLMDKKVGYFFTQLTRTGDTATSVNEMHFKANVGTQISDRYMKETKVYEATPGGKLLSMTVESKGDGGDQLLKAKVTAKGLEVERSRPGQPTEQRVLPAPKETVEDADQARVALLRKKRVEGTVTDSIDLEQYKVASWPTGESTRIVAGVPVKLRQVTTLSDKEKVPAEDFFDEQGRMFEQRYGPTMRAVAESKDVAMKLDKVEVFGLTRVVLPKPLPDSAQAVPAKVTLVVKELPEKFQTNGYRQKYKAAADGQVEVTLLAVAPKERATRPVADPNGGENLKSTIIVEADHPDIKAKAAELSGSEKDAYTVAKKISRWVNESLRKDYGQSKDRAADVLKAMKGDCTEHSLLTVALLRAAGIPAKRVDGVVYLKQEDGVPALYWHEWVEAYVGEWTQLDPTFGEDVVKATHWALGEEARAEITPLIGALKVLDVK